MSDKQRLAVTGLSGLIGSRFAQLYGHKYDFTTIDLTSGIDITDSKAVDKIIKSTPADNVLHLAAYTDVNSAHLQNNDKSGSCYQVNVKGTENLVKAAKKYLKYFILISTDFVFDGTKKKPYTEEDRPNPIEWYGTTKRLAEEIVTKTLEKRQFSIIRPSFPFRADYPEKLDLIRKIIKGLEEDNLPPMFTDHFITPTFIDDLCKVFFMFTLKRPSGIYHATGSTALSDFELATIVKKTFNLPGKIKPGSLQDFLKTAPRPYQQYLRMSNRKLQEELGNPMLPIESALMIMKTQITRPQ